MTPSLSTAPHSSANPLAWVQITTTQTIVLLFLVVGASWEQLRNYVTGIDSPVTGFREFNGTLLGANPTSLVLFLGPEFDHVDRSISLGLSQLIAHFTSLTRVEIRIHESVWSQELADQLTPLPASVKDATFSVSDFHSSGFELFRVQFNASARPFTTSFTASFLGLSLIMEGYLSDFPFMFALPRRLAKITFGASCTARIQVNRERVLHFEISGKMGDVQSIMEALARIGREFQYTIHLLSISVPMLHRQDEFNIFLSALPTHAPSLQILMVQINALHRDETAQWMDGLRNLINVRGLTRVDIVHPRPLPLLDGDIAWLLAAWRNAEYISLNPKPSSSMVLNPGQPSLTRNALKGVAVHAPVSLKHLGLYLDAERISVLGSGNIRPQVGVRSVELGVARAGSAQRSRDVVNMARRLFPNAEVVLA
ncbi:hypothetical protein BT96DRAFT_501468 [Gymnopus androsaceus JB14]|uniref:Uncharacterized protein n=1 Tax=Gymnopus androsaceus JB14 TaxID=1447944 RepID=A0A6A4GP17_9AGAR|nr:hypothetical protein BT96DRAFT_501468 [Gymnopus androsaceus JB14]